MPRQTTVDYLANPVVTATTAVVRRVGVAHVCGVRFTWIRSTTGPVTLCGVHRTATGDPMCGLRIRVRESDLAAAVGTTSGHAHKHDCPP